MNGQDIDSILSSTVFTRTYFKGVFAINQLSELVFPREGWFSYVLNLDPSYLSGSHWTALILNSCGPHTYFDSYGLAPPQELFIFLDKNVKWNSQTLQHPLSTTCGQWCIFYILLQSMGISLNKMLSLFSTKRLLQNDHKVNHYVQLLFKRFHRRVIDKPFLNHQLCRSLQENAAHPTKLHTWIPRKK